MTELITVADARALVLEHARPLARETVDLDHAAGRVLAADARAAVDLPPFPSSAMDGFAVRASDTPGRLRVVARVAAGRPSPHALSPGEAAGIATGAVVPEGADAVVPVESTSDEGGSVNVPGAVARGSHIRPRGGDTRAGDVVLAAGAALGSAQVAALAAAGIARVVCHRQPRVAVLTTGTELRAPGDVLGPGEIYESNGRMLEVALHAAGAIVTRLASIADDEDAHRASLEQALAADVTVTSGGVSVGPHDLVRRVGAALGVEEVFWGVAMRPGKPLSFAVRGATLVFGLPGNPVSALVGATLFVVPALRALQGASSPGPEWQAGMLAVAAARNPWRDDFIRARMTVGDSGVTLHPVAGQESHMIVRAAGADALVHVPAGEGEIGAGAAVRYTRLV